MCQKKKKKKGPSEAEDETGWRRLFFPIPEERLTFFFPSSDVGESDPKRGNLDTIVLRMTKRSPLTSFFFLPSFPANDIDITRRCVRLCFFSSYRPRMFDQKARKVSSSSSSPRVGCLYVSDGLTVHLAGGRKRKSVRRRRSRSPAGAACWPHRAKKKKKKRRSSLRLSHITWFWWGGGNPLFWGSHLWPPPLLLLLLLLPPSCGGV